MKHIWIARALVCATVTMAALPAEARFLQVDPVGYKDQNNLYEYVGNDPVNKADPTGMEGIGLWNDPQQMRHQGERDGLAIKRAVQEAAGATKDFARNYNEMRQANTIGADKYFHCMANCEAATRGPVAEKTAEKLSNAREVTDQRIKGDPRSASLADQKANHAGREAGEAARQSRPADPNALRPANSENVCRAGCNQFRPKDLDKKY